MFKIINDMYLIIILILSFPTLASADITTNLIGWWKFDEGGGATAIDSSGNSNNGNIINSPSSVTGKLNTALSFNGSSQYVTLPDNLITPLSTITLSAWIKTSSGGGIIGYNNAACCGGVTGWTPALYVGTDGKVRGEIWIGGVNPSTSPSTYTDNLWHHVVLTVSSTLQTLYIDGVSVATLAGAPNNFGGNFNQIGVAHTNLWPGGNGGWYYFPGLIDDVRIYNRTLTSSDVLELYNWGAIKFGNSAYIADLTYQ